MTTKITNCSELHVDAAASDEKNQQKQDNGTKTNDKSIGSATVDAGGKSNAKRSK